MDPRVASAWELLRDDIEDYEDLWLARDSEGFGDYFFAWTQVEECWREGISVDDVIASIDLAEIGLEDDARRLFWLAGLPGAIADSNLRFPISHVSPILESVVFRHSILRLDVRDYIEPAHYGLVESLNLQYAANRLGIALHCIQPWVGPDDAADFLSLTELEVELVKEKLPRIPLGFGRGSTQLSQLTPAVERMRAHPQRPIDALQQLLARSPGDRERMFALGAYLALSGDAKSGLEYLAKADEMHDSDSIGWRDFVMRYFYVDCCAALSVQPERTFANVIELPESQGFFDGMEAYEYGQTDLYLAFRSWAVLEGVVSPLIGSGLGSPNAAEPGSNRSLTITESSVVDAIQNLARMIDVRMTSIIDIALDVKLDQQTVNEILTAAGETRIERAENIFKEAVPDWEALRDESRRELIAGELEYRAYTAGERSPEHAAAVAVLLCRAVEREMERLPVAFEPPQWKVFKEGRNRTAHPDEFSEIDLIRMRSYLLGLYRGKDSLLGAIAKRCAGH